MVCPQGWTLSPRGNVHPFVHPRGVYCLEEWRNLESHPQVITSPFGDKVHSWGTTSPLGV
jgi:hypothetical protein